jgi:hypothetical protein
MERIRSTVHSTTYSKSRTTILIISLVSVIAWYGCRDDQLVLSDFDSEADLDRVKWQCHTLFSIADENATHGNSSLLLELYPSAYPGIAFELPEHNWSGYTMLSLDIYNPQEEVISLAMRIDDRKESPEFNDRYNQSFPLKPGMNHLRIPLASMVTTGTKRPINVKNVCRYLLFIAQPQIKRVLYIDYVHLA